MFDTTEFIAAADRAVREEGFRKATDPQSTKAVAIATLEAPGWETITPEEYERAREIVAWVQANVKGRNDFEQKMLLVTVSDTVSARAAGIAAYLPEAYRRAQERAAAQADEVPEEDRVPVCEMVGQGFVEGTVRKLSERCGTYGFQWKALVVTSGGTKLWGTVPKAGLAQRVAVGDQVAFKATVKASNDDEFFGFWSRPSGWMTRKVEEEAVKS